jgi:uroporphyrin-III C-methyltransferase
VKAVGRVALVGAGPGDPGLLTVRGRHLLRRADVVVYDRLVDARVLELVPPHARVVFVGKESGHHTEPQDEINALLIAEARRGHRVVRLKGGDPFVLGRGGEEAAALRAAGVCFEVVPGVSSAIAAPAYAGIPVTHRGVASSFAVVTGHECAGKRQGVDWAALATAVDTIVVLMGAGRLQAIARELIAHGRAAHTPTALVRSATTREQETVMTTLAAIAAGDARLPAPVVMVVGEVVGLGPALRWFDRRQGGAQAPRYARRTWSSASKSDARPSRTTRPVSIT